jgi:hypothetical protein
MRRALAIIRKPTVWLLLFLAWSRFFWSQVPPPPQVVLHTGAAYVPGFWRGPEAWADLRCISDAGDQVTLAVFHGDPRFPQFRLKVWDVRTGADRTPGLWKEPDWERYLPTWEGRGITALLSHPIGREFLGDEAAWARLRRWFTPARERALNDLPKDHRQAVDKLDPYLPRTTSFAPDGQHLAYVTRDGWPLFVASESLGDGTAVEDVRTGARLAFLPGVTGEIHLAPGGRTAVSVNEAVEGKGEQPRLLLWDLETSSRRAELLLPERPFRVQYSADGRLVFARYHAWTSDRAGLRWWDAATGRQVGAVDYPWDTAFIDGGRVLVTRPWAASRRPARESYVLNFWDVATGAPLGEWDLGAPSDGGGTIWYLHGSEDRSFLVAEYEPINGRASRVSRLIMALTKRSPPEDHCVLLLDVSRRREVARLPGWSAVLSRNGRWLATLDKTGVVQVWEVPVRRPWAGILGYAAAATLICGTGLVLVRRLGRRWWSPGLAGRLGRGLGRLWTDRRRRRWAAGILGCLALLVGFGVWYEVSASRARAALLTAFEEIQNGMTEAEVTALVGWPPDEGPVGPITGRKKGGQSGNPKVLRMWSRFGTELEVWLGENGTVKGRYISEPPSMEDRVATWLGM